MGAIPNEVLHYALIALGVGINAAAIVIWWFIRRDLDRSAQDEAAKGLAHAALREEFTAHVRRSGMEIKDVQYKMGIMASQVQRVIPEVDIPEWPDR
jgi:hypothetical protein